MIAQGDIGLLDGFERALINGRLRMVYQPKVSLTDGRLRRVEALVRWDDPELGAISPSKFVPLAEKHGLIDQLTHWGLRTTLRQWLNGARTGSTPALPSTFRRSASTTSTSPTWSSGCAARSKCRPTGWCWN
jgi:EAL domain-containing protein (putative c-di-GMP-specific phosphodiesterase class I)